MANDKAFRIKNGLSAVRYLSSNGVVTVNASSYDLANTSYDNVSFSILSQTNDPYDIAFKPDGTKMFISDNQNDTVLQYSLSTAWDLSTATYDSVSFSVAAQEVAPRGLSFKSDGTKMYIAGNGSNRVHQYSLSTAWDLSTASYDSVSFDVTGQDSNIYGVTFKTDGTKMYVATNLSDLILQYSLSTAWDVSTASYDSKQIADGATYGNPNCIEFSDDGTILYISGKNTDIFQYDLSTAWDISTASYSSIFFDYSAQDGGNGRIAIGKNGEKLYFAGNVNDTVYQYSMGPTVNSLDTSSGNFFSFSTSGPVSVSFTNPPASGTAVSFSVEVNGDGSAITWPTSVKWHLATAPTATANKELYTFVTTDGGTTYYGKKAAEGLA